MTVGTRIGRTFRWAVINLGLFALFYYMVFGEMATYQLWADRAFTFYVFVSGIAGWLSLFLSDEKWYENFKEWEPVIPSWLDSIYDIVMLMAIVSQGLWWTALTYFGVIYSSAKLYKMYNARKELLK